MSEMTWRTCRKNLLDEYPEDPNYTPLEEDRPGGFNWGAPAVAQNNANAAGGQEAAAAGGRDEGEAAEPNNQNNNNNNQ